ncbi:MAG: potassium transporter TrkA [Candidatus Marinimicrobia bacterium CG08_land_8_20_14_0_20_45_22]|nr:MAG: potassium transporter TrkA [Candidatus Marinimicrobia bacterium CG08_land_8_20_14_0_20_45_22]
MAKDKVFAVFGLGTFGMEVCRSLSEKGGKVIAIDNSPTLIEKAKNMVMQAILLDSTDEESLKNAPTEDIDVAVVAIGEKIEASILTTAILKNIGVPYIISRATSELHGQVLRQVGASDVINIEISQGERVAERLISPEIKDKMQIAGNIYFAEVTVSRQIVGKSILELELRKRSNINVIGIKRIHTDIDDLGNPSEKSEVEFPKPTTVLAKGDILIVVGTETDIDRMKEL